MRVGIFFAGTTTIAVFSFGVFMMLSGIMISATAIQINEVIFWMFALLSTIVMFFPEFGLVSIGGIISCFCAGYAIGGIDLQRAFVPDLQLIWMLISVYAVLIITILVIIERIRPRAIDVTIWAMRGNLPVILVWVYVLHNIGVY